MDLLVKFLCKTIHTPLQVLRAVLNPNSIHVPAGPVLSPVCGKTAHPYERGSLKRRTGLFLLWCILIAVTASTNSHAGVRESYTQFDHPMKKEKKEKKGGKPEDLGIFKQPDNSPLHVYEGKKPTVKEFRWAPLPGFPEQRFLVP